MVNDNLREKVFKKMVNELLKLISFLLTILKDKENQLKPKYKLVDWIEKGGKGLCRIQVVNTSYVATYSPQDIVADDDFIKGFHPHDLRTIVNLANHEINKPKAKITSIIYDTEKFITVRKLDGNKTNVSIDEVRKSKQLINDLNSADAFNLGRLVGDDDNTIDQASLKENGL